MAEDRIYPFRNLTDRVTEVGEDHVSWDLENMTEATEAVLELGCKQLVKTDENNRQSNPLTMETCIASNRVELEKERPSAACSAGEIAMRVPYQGDFTYDRTGKPTLYPIPEDLKDCYWTDQTHSSLKCHSSGRATWVSDLGKNAVFRREEFVCVDRERYDAKGDLSKA